MRQEGVEVRGIVQPDGTAEFCEVFFTNARCPKDNVVGGVNNGWKVTNSTLAFERGMSATTGYRRFEEEYKMMVRVATENGTIEQEDIRQRLMEYYTKIQILRINGLRSLTATLNNSKDFGVMALGASNKMFWSEMHKAAMELALDIFGAQGMLVDAGPETGSWPGVAREKRREGRRSSSVALKQFGAAPARSSATLLVNEFWACPRSRQPVERTNGDSAVLIGDRGNTCLLHVCRNSDSDVACIHQERSR
jgi:hypothetical protein